MKTEKEVGGYNIERYEIDGCKVRGCEKSSEVEVED